MNGRKLGGLSGWGCWVSGQKHGSPGGLDHRRREAGGGQGAEAMQGLAVSRRAGVEEDPETRLPVS